MNISFIVSCGGLVVFKKRLTSPLSYPFKRKVIFAMCFILNLFYAYY
jgi:hypothetical protein